MTDTKQPDLFDWKPRAPEPTPAPRPAAALLDHELWPSLRPYLKVERLARHRRLEVSSNMPADLRGVAQQLVVPCAACGESIFPFRCRRGPKGRGDESGNLYLSVTCPLEVKVGCSRGRAAQLATLALVAAVEA